MTTDDVRLIALVVFLANFVELAVGLAVDLALHLCGKRTISAMVWDEPALGVVVLLPTLAMTAGLAVHLWYGAR